jgi:hypothetical protein
MSITINGKAKNFLISTSLPLLKWRVCLERQNSMDTATHRVLPPRHMEEMREIDL